MTTQIDHAVGDEAVSGDLPTVLTVQSLSKRFEGGSRRSVERVQAIDGVSFEVRKGELFTLLGPSGCGKSTTLRSIAGLEVPEAGKIIVGERVLFDSDQRVSIATEDRGIGVVFQSYAIWPHMNVAQNVAFPLTVGPRRARLGRTEIKKRTARVLEVVQLDHLASRSATKLSGGQQQRLALARALIMEPPLLLLDEPLSNLDAKLREDMRFELKRLQRDLGITCVYVTHDQTEALSMSSQIAVMNQGRIEQRGTPREIYSRPATRFVADFIGTSNFVDATVVQRDGARLRVTSVLGVFDVDSASQQGQGAEVVLAVRPEGISLVPDSGSSPLPAGSTTGVVEERAYQGEIVAHLVAVGDHKIRVHTPASQSYRTGTRVLMTVDSTALTVIAE